MKSLECQCIYHATEYLVVKESLTCSLAFCFKVLAFHQLLIFHLNWVKLEATVYENFGKGWRKSLGLFSSPEPPPWQKSASWANSQVCCSLEAQDVFGMENAAGGGIQW